MKTPFEEAGYTKDTKFKVLSRSGNLFIGDTVTLFEDDGVTLPCFKTEDGRKGYMILPDNGTYSELEVVREIQI